MRATVSKDDQMLAFMLERQNLILNKGLMHKRTPLWKALPPGPKERKLRHRWYKQAHAAAKRQAAMQPSDPFLYGRAINLMEQGVYAPYELNVKHGVAV